MKKSLFNILKGVGSLFDIMPSQKRTNYKRFVLRTSAMDITAYAFAKTGKDIAKAIGEYSHDQENQVLPCTRHQ